MKAILISIRPEWVANILNGLKTIEVRKKFPSDYVGWVYIYVTKENDKHEICIYDNPIEHRIVCSRYHFLDHSEDARVSFFNPRYIKGKVVARFWCDRVENVLNVGSDYGCFLESESIRHNMEAVYSFYRRCCIEWEDFTKRFIDKNNRHKPLFAINITKLKIFDKPKEIDEFHKIGYQEELKELQAEMEEFEGIWDTSKYYENFRKKFQLTRAPQNWQYIEVQVYES